MAKTYTRTGDNGTTTLPGRKGIAKSHPLLEVLGHLDELNAFVGFIRSSGIPPHVEKVLSRIQTELFSVSSDVYGEEKRMQESHVQQLEHEIDEIEKNLTPLTNFIVPQGCGLAALLHTVRAICRRAERSLNRAVDAKTHPHSYAYINRLSDWFFVHARKANWEEGVRDQPACTP